ncbi:pah6 homeobox protein encoded by the pah6 protein [Podospora australis]|uniref:Pah6 homeobox protein encoded by the pah6 protein n=1 Tax=Podospora australis TaxID=1536484 RepID=A0AAN6X879_9PEZI|nr:pah6 homeobox protein encoded by the pah6 protein [Podospora australis]
MPVIPEEMDEFVNWDQAADPVPGMASGTGGFDMNVLSSSVLPSTTDPMHELDLALENAEGDDFSFWALEHFENTISPTLNSIMDTATSAALTSGVAREGPFEDDLEMPDVPCSNCRIGGYQCKRIPEGQHKGYCTSCVALRSQCSFGSESGSGVAEGFPSNTWPLMGDHPMVIPDAHTENCSAEPTTTEQPASRSGSTSGQAKAGARFSRESVKILKNWLSTHSKHPYPNDEEKDLLQRQTGLTKLQITNWLANTRRRNKNAVAQRSTSPGVRNWSKPIDIPSRRGIPSLELMNPLQRWQHSPPENEPASVAAIANAINTSGANFSSGLSSPYSLNLTDDGSGRSLCDSAISSANTSHSSTNSFASAYSFGSRRSFGSDGSMPRGRRRRRRKAAAAPAAASIPLRQPLKTFQCTFCTETFRTKHDWQRHEKSLHLSLERWVCSPEGAVAFSPESNQMSCVFCGLANPDAAHIESHDHSACQERTLADRTFYRKDHLRQHLKLVHHTKYIGWSMDQWKVTTPEIRSRCGFCGIIMDTWSVRIDHLAEHFKRGKSMADWKGDWGFEDPVLNMVENSIPPYLIHDERNSPDPFEASHPSTSARNAYELIKSELVNYIDEKKGAPPSDGELLDVAHQLLRQTQTVSRPCVGSTGSWLQDLLLQPAPNDKFAGEAPSSKRVSHSQLKINGKGNIFELDPMELELDVYVKARRLLGLTAMDRELQAEACNIIRRMDETSHDPSEEVVGFLTRLACASTCWLACFRQRAHLPRSEDVGVEGKRSKDPNKIDSTIHNPVRLEFELAEYVREQKALGVELTDAELQKRARIIIYEYDDGWNQTAADDAVWLSAFKERYLVADTDPCIAVKNITPLPISHAGMWPKIWSSSENNFQVPPQQPAESQQQLLNQYSHLALSLSGASSSSSAAGISPTATHTSSGSCTQSGGNGGGKSPSKLLGDVNCYQRLARELKKYVASAMSPNNPNQHVPSDEELQHQARWIIYEDDDPWNTTAAENAEWLRRFKRDAGILTDDDTMLSGLPDTLSWNINQGGSGFAPPYTIPNPALVNANVNVPGLQSSDDLHMLTLRDGTKPFTAPGATVNRFVQALHTRHDPPATVFCSRELERGLIEFVSTSLSFPADEALKQKAREILGTPTTPADDEVLLNTFKEMMKSRLDLSGQQQQQQQQQQGEMITMGQIIQDMEMDDFDFDFTDMGVSPYKYTGGERQTENTSTGLDFDDLF